MRERGSIEAILYQSSAPARLLAPDTLVASTTTKKEDQPIATLTPILPYEDFAAIVRGVIADRRAERAAYLRTRGSS